MPLDASKLDSSNETTRSSLSMETAESVHYTLRAKYLADSEQSPVQMMYCPLTFSKNVITPLLRNEFEKLKEDLATYNKKWDEIDHFGIAWKSEDNIHKIIQKEYSKQRRRRITHDRPESNTMRYRKRRSEVNHQAAKHRRIEPYISRPEDIPPRPTATLFDIPNTPQQTVQTHAAATSPVTTSETPPIRQTTDSSEENNTHSSPSTAAPPQAPSQGTATTCTSDRRTNNQNTQALPSTHNLNNHQTPTTSFNTQNQTTEPIDNQTMQQPIPNESPVDTPLSSYTTIEGTHYSPSIFSLVAQRARATANMIVRHTQAAFTLWKHNPHGITEEPIPDSATTQQASET